MIRPKKADLEVIKLVHSEEQIQLVLDSKYDEDKLEEGEKVLQDVGESHYIGPDVFANQYTADCALMAVGGTV